MFWWVSAPDFVHSRNIAARPDVAIVVYDTGPAPLPRGRQRAVGTRRRHWPRSRRALRRRHVVQPVPYSQRSVRGVLRIRSTRTGTPAATALSGTSFVTIVEVPSTQLSPTVAPRRIATP